MHFHLTYFLHIPALWKIAAINTVEKYRRVDIIVEHDTGTLWACPHCPQSEHRLPCRDHIHLHQWRHQILFDAGGYLHAQFLRVFCEKHRSCADLSTVGGCQCADELWDGETGYNGVANVQVNCCSCLQTGHVQENLAASEKADYQVYVMQIL